MRTTITLDFDVRALIQNSIRERGISFKEAVNEAIRAGLTQGTAKRKPFVQRSASLGADQMFRWDKALATATAIEDRALARKLSGL
jgi:hypothetical protein